MPDLSDWPGKRLGLPESGPRSIGRFGRRLGALAIDWALAVLVSFAFFNYNSWATLAIFAVAQIVFLLTLNGSVGHLILGMRVVPIARRLPGRRLAAVRANRFTVASSSRQ